MRKIPRIMLAAGLILLSFSSINQSKEIQIMDMVDNIHWLGQATVKIIANGKTVYIDPYQIKKADKADIILVTHGHGDHLSPEDILKISTDHTILVAPGDCLRQITGISPDRTILAAPGMKKQLGDIHIEAIPAYNLVKTDYHPKTNKWVGYVLMMNGIRIYHAGDTEKIPEMKNIHCDIAMLPLGQTYTMNSVKEASEAAIDVKAKIAIPIHYGLYEGKKEDALEFKELLKDKVKVLIKQIE